MEELARSPQDGIIGTMFVFCATLLLLAAAHHVGIVPAVI